MINKFIKSFLHNRSYPIIRHFSKDNQEIFFFKSISKKSNNFSFIVKKLDGIYNQDMIDYINYEIPKIFDKMDYLRLFPDAFEYYKSLKQDLPKEYIENFERLFFKRGVVVPLLHYDNFIIYSIDNQLVRVHPDTISIMLDILKRISITCEEECFEKIINFIIDCYSDENIVTFRIKDDMLKYIDNISRENLNDYKKSLLLKLTELRFQDIQKSLMTGYPLKPALLITTVNIMCKYQTIYNNILFSLIIKGIRNNITYYDINSCCNIMDNMFRLKRKNEYDKNVSDIFKIVEEKMPELSNIYQIKSKKLN